MRTTILAAILLLCVVFYFFIGQDRQALKQRQLIERMQASEEIFIQFNNALHADLSQAVQKYGAADSMAVCEQVEQQIEKETLLQNSHIVSVRRVSLKTFNPGHHTPNAPEKAWLMKMDICPVCRTQPGPVILEDATSLTVVFPIYMDETECLLCHGKVDTLQEDVRKTLASTYAKHQALGYQRNDFCGGFAVAWMKPDNPL